MAARTSRRAATAADEQLQDPDLAGEDATLGPPSVADPLDEAHQNPDDEVLRFAPNAEEQANLDAIAGGNHRSTVLAAIEHAKDDPELDTPAASLPAADGVPRIISAQVVDNALVYVRVGKTPLLLTTDEALALSGAIGAVAVELVR